MKKILFLVLCFALSLSTLSCGKDSAKKIYKKRIQKMERASSNPTNIEELEAAIEKYSNDIDEIVAKTEKTGMWYKLLGSRYIEKKMYSKAYDCYIKALDYYPENEILYYYAGTCAVHIANESIADRNKCNEYLDIAERSYLRSLAIDDRYAYSLYGISVLYVYQLNKPQDAIKYLTKLLTIDTKNTDAMFVLSNAYYLTRNYDAAVDTLQKLKKIAKSDKIKQKAQENIQQILEEANVQ